MIQMLLDRSHDERLIAADKRVRQLYKENQSSLKHFVDNDTDDRAAILVVLNNLEFLSSGVNMGTFDDPAPSLPHSLTNQPEGIHVPPATSRGIS